MYQHVNGMRIAMASNLSICGGKLLRLGEPAKQPACGLHTKHLLKKYVLLRNYLVITLFFNRFRIVQMILVLQHRKDRLPDFLAALASVHTVAIDEGDATEAAHILDAIHNILLYW